jgi:hypothetical protein
MFLKGLNALGLNLTEGNRELNTSRRVRVAFDLLAEELAEP